MVATAARIKMVADVEYILNDGEFFGDTVETPKEGVEQHRKRECLNVAISKDKVPATKLLIKHILNTSSVN